MRVYLCVFLCFGAAAAAAAALWTMKMENNKYRTKTVLCFFRDFFETSGFSSIYKYGYILSLGIVPWFRLHFFVFRFWCTRTLETLEMPPHSASRIFLHIQRVWVGTRGTHVATIGYFRMEVGLLECIHLNFREWVTRIYYSIMYGLISHSMCEIFLSQL